MLEPACAFIKPVQTRALASHPEITACILENAIDFSALAEAVRAGNIVGDAAALAIQSIKGAGERADPQDAVGVLVERADRAGRETVGVFGTMGIVADLSLPKSENVPSAISRAHPQQPGPIAVDGNNAVVAEAVRFGSRVLVEASETLGAPGEGGEPQAGRHPEAIRSISEKSAAVQQRRPGAERIFGEPLALAVVFDQTG